MAFDLTQFRANMEFDGARNNNFEVQLQFPLIAGANPAAQTKFSLMCRSTQIPGSSVGQVPVNYFGREIKVPGNRTFSEWTVTVYNDEDYSVKNQFDRWINALNTHSANLRSPNALTSSNYSTDPLVIHYGKTGNVIQKWKLIGAFPVDVAPIDLDWAQNDTIGEFSITLAYQWTENADQNIL